MTSDLRRAHSRIWIVLAILVPLLFVLAVALREDTTPPNQQIRWEEPR